MAEITLGLVGPAIKVVKWVGAPILRQFKYLCCLTTNITNLINEAQKLQATERDLQGKVDTARNDVRLISGEVETWLQDSKKIKDEMDGILNEIPNLESGCLKLGGRFLFSKRAKKTTDRLKELRDQCKFDADSISQPGPPAATKAVPLERTYNFDSRKKIEEDIMTTLGGTDVNMMGIWGMGGLGKTTMAKRIWNRVLEEHVFQEVVMAVVSQPVDESKIQLEIGGLLGLKLEDETSQAARVQKLHARLSGTTRILLILDDVWERFKPEALGIPRGYKGCTILLTSRNRDVLNAMNVQKIFGMEVLSEEDSWFLFKEGVGTCVDGTKLNSIAKKVVSECAGLPIALITVGVALKVKSDEYAWKSALRQLERCDLYIPDFIKEAYNTLQLSYDALELMCKSVFLLCCLYPEDADIPLERLNYICMGLRIFEVGIGDVEDERNRMHTLIDVLKDRSLLLDSNEGSDYVRMHDVVRDVGIFIARKNNYISGGDSSLQRYKSDSGSRLLQIRNSEHEEINVDGIRNLYNSADEEIKFDRIRDLYVLSIEKSSLTSLPFTSNNLITLVLDSCRGLETLSVVGDLVNLEILICRDCQSIEELPPEIRLNRLRLKVLDLTGCGNLQRIGRGIISSLVELEELKMLGSFIKWEEEDREGKENAGLRELEVLTKLRCLEMDIEDRALAAKNIRLSSKVDRFTIRLLYRYRWLTNFNEFVSNKKMCLDWKGATCLGDWIKKQLRDTECLLLVGNGANEVGLTNLEKIRCLELGECEGMKKVVTSSMDDGGATVFPSIEYLKLFRLPKLEEILDDRISSNSFQNLKILELIYLSALKQLWKGSQNDLGKDFLPQLEVLIIRRCEMMEAVFLRKGEDGNEYDIYRHISKIFPKLEKLCLQDLPNLTSFCQGIAGIEFPLLRRIEIEECGKMKRMVSTGNNLGGSCRGSFCLEEVSFGCLKELKTDRNPFYIYIFDVSLLNGLEELEISKCAGSRSLFTSSMVGNLVNLKELCVSNCSEMVEVIKDDEKGMSGGRQRPLLFPKLQAIKLWGLPKLMSFCESTEIESIQFPVLRSMEIKRCKKMKGMIANELTSNDNNSGGSNINAHPNFFCESQLVSFDCIKKLDTHCNPFSELEELEIYQCQGIMSLFTSSIARNLVNLKELWIHRCEEMVEVIKDDEEKGMSGGQRAHLLFPKLQTIRLWDLPKLVSFCESKRIESIQFPVLRSMEVKGCEKMKGMVANGLTSNDNNSGGSNSNAHAHLLCESQQVSFGCLKELQTHKNPFCSHTIRVSQLNGLEKLEISQCTGNLSLFTSSIAENLLNLQVLQISYCAKMVRVIIDDEEKGISGGALFPKLHTIYLSYLRKLVSFSELKCDVEFPSLRKVDIDGCPNMKNFTLGSLAAPNLKSFKTDLKDYLLQVPFYIAKKISVQWIENPLNCYQIHGSVFDRLEVLKIESYEGSMSLFSSSITRNLVNLTKLTMEHCYEMVKVIEDEEEKEKEVSGGQSTLLFPKLHKLHLVHLRDLVSFCEWKCDVEFPSLRELRIHGCHNMKSCTLGSLAAPNLKSVKIDDQYFGAVKDLNDILQQQYINRTKEKQAEEAVKKKKGGEEEQERKGEIEEEQN